MGPIARQAGRHLLPEQLPCLGLWGSFRATCVMAFRLQWRDVDYIRPYTPSLETFSPGECNSPFKIR